MEDVAIGDDELCVHRLCHIAKRPGALHLTIHAEAVLVVEDNEGVALLRQFGNGVQRTL